MHYNCPLMHFFKKFYNFIYLMLRSAKPDGTKSMEKNKYANNLKKSDQLTSKSFFHLRAFKKFCYDD